MTPSRRNQLEMRDALPGSGQEGRVSPECTSAIEAVRARRGYRYALGAARGVERHAVRRGRGGGISERTRYFCAILICARCLRMTPDAR